MYVFLLFASLQALFFPFEAYIDSKWEEEEKKLRIKLTQIKSRSEMGLVKNVHIGIWQYSLSIYIFTSVQSRKIITKLILFKKKINS